MSNRSHGSSQGSPHGSSYGSSHGSSHGLSQGPPCDPPQWIRGNQLGGDPRSKTHLALHAESGQIFVAKSVSSRALPRDMRQLDNEQAILEELRGSPRVVRLLGANWEDDAAVPGARVRNLFMEYISGGSIADLMSSFGGRLPEALVRRYARGICEGLRDLHARGIVHCDIRAANVLLNGDKGEAKLCSFGSAIRAADGSAAEAAGARKPPPARFQGAGAYSWMAPEVVRQEAQGCAADIWSFACTVLEMITGEPPWTAQLEAAGFAAAPGSAVGGGGGARACDRDAVLHMIGSTFEVPHIPAEVSPECRSLLRRCLERDPANRPSAMLLLDHAFLLPSPCPPLFRLLGGGSIGGIVAANGVANSGAFGVPAAGERLRTPDRYRVGLPRSASAGSAEESGSATGMAAGMVAGMGPGGFNAPPPLTPPSSLMHSHSGYPTSLSSPNTAVGGSGGGFISPGSGGGGPGGAMGGGSGGGLGGGGLGGAAGGGASLDRPPTRRTPLQRSQSQPKQLISTHVSLPGTGNPVCNPNPPGVIANLAQGSPSSIPPTGKASSRNVSPMTKPPPPPAPSPAGSGSAGANPNLPMLDLGANSMNPALAAAIPGPPALTADAAGGGGGATGTATGGGMPLGPVLVPPPGIRMGPLMRQISKGQEAIRAAAAMAAAGGTAAATAAAGGGAGAGGVETESGFLPHHQAQARATPPRPGLPRSSSGGSSGNYSVSFGNGSSSVSGGASGGPTGGAGAGSGYNSSGSGGGSSGYSAALPPSPEGVTSPNTIFSAPSPPSMPPRRPHAHRRSHSISPEHGHLGFSAAAGANLGIAVGTGGSAGGSSGGGAGGGGAGGRFGAYPPPGVGSGGGAGAGSGVGPGGNGNSSQIQQQQLQQHHQQQLQQHQQQHFGPGSYQEQSAPRPSRSPGPAPLARRPNLHQSSSSLSHPRSATCLLASRTRIHPIPSSPTPSPPPPFRWWASRTRTWQSSSNPTQVLPDPSPVPLTSIPSPPPSLFFLPPMPRFPSPPSGDGFLPPGAACLPPRHMHSDPPYPHIHLFITRLPCPDFLPPHQVVGFSDTDVAELLYSKPSIQEADFKKQLCHDMTPTCRKQPPPMPKPSIQEADFKKQLCHDMTPTCRKQPPPMPKGRKPGEAFRRKSSTEVERERMMRDMDLKSEKYREEVGRWGTSIYGSSSPPPPSIFPPPWFVQNPRAPRMPKMKLYSRDDLLRKTSVGGMGMGEDEEDEEEGEEEDPEEKLRNELGPGTNVDMEAIRAALKAADEKVR
ncbi:unnamed protein product [Closterium sp. NIES-53]